MSNRRPPTAAPSEFIRQNLHIAAFPLLSEIRLHVAHPASGLRRLAERRDDGSDPTPYWAYLWAGGALNDVTSWARHHAKPPAASCGRIMA